MKANYINQIENANLKIKKLNERITKLNENIENIAFKIFDIQEKNEIIERILIQKKIIE